MPASAQLKKINNLKLDNLSEGFSWGGSLSQQPNIAGSFLFSGGNL